MTGIYTSKYPSTPLVRQSIFQRLFWSSDNDPNAVGGFDGSLTAFIDSETGTELTRRQLKNLALKFGYGLRHHPKTRLKRGNTVLIYCPNSIVWPVMIFGCVAIGVTCAFVNNNYTYEEVATHYDQTRPKLVITTDEGFPVIKDALRVARQRDGCPVALIEKDLGWIDGMQTPSSSSSSSISCRDLLSNGTLEKEEDFSGVSADDTAYICFSSGTSGQPKGVMLTHYNITSELMCVDAVWPSVDHQKDRLYGVLPLFHVYALFMNLHLTIMNGLTTIIAPRFDLLDFFKDLERYKVTMAPIVPPIAIALANHPIVDKYVPKHLRYMVSGAAPLGEELVYKVKKRLKELRPSSLEEVTLVQGYGMTELSPISHGLTESDPIHKCGSIGRILPNLEGRIVTEGENDAELGQPGELWIRGPIVMKGYLDNEKATEETITSDGWLKTGDVATVDSEGYFYIVDRLKELIKYKGFQVAPAELESVLLTHPDVVDSAVIGVMNHDGSTELPRAYVVPKSDTTTRPGIFATDVQNWIKGKVAKHKHLRGGVVVIDAIPKSASGKILRRELRLLAAKEHKEVLKSKL